MSWLKLLNVLLSLSSRVAEIVKNKQLMDAGEAKATIKALKKGNKNVAKARDIERVADPARDKRLRDKYRAPSE